METIGSIIAIQILIITIILLNKKYTVSLTLLLMGSIMFIASYFFVEPKPEIGFFRHCITLLSTIYDTLSNRLIKTGLLIMLIGGYVEYMKRIGASDIFVYIAMQPLSILKKYPYLAAVLFIPIGQFAFLAIPSALGFGLLMITSVYPILLGLGVSRLTALSVISACTVFDLGITSSNTIVASGILQMDVMDYFSYQLKLIVPLTLLMIPLYYIVNKKADKIDHLNEKKYAQSVDISKLKKDTPLYFGILPVLPLIFTVLFSNCSTLQADSTYVYVSYALILSFIVGSTLDLIRRRNLKDTFSKMSFFWHGMSRSFSTVVILIVAADLFSEGLIKLKFIDLIMGLSDSLGFEKGIYVVLPVISFLATIITGSGVAAFTAVGELIPEITSTSSIDPLSLMLPVQLITGLARSASPIAVVIISISEISGESPINLVKRNLIPIITISIFLILLSLFTI